MAVTYLIISALVLRATADTAAQGRHTLEDVYNLVSRIDENLRKEDRLREIAQIVRVDATMKSVEKRLGELIERMDRDGLGRGISSDLRSDLETIGDRMERMEETAGALKTMMAKMDADLEKLEQLKQTTGKLEKDLELRLTKLMNAISSLHEMNKRLSNSLQSSGNSRSGEETTGLTSSRITFLTEYLDELERKVKEQLSVLEAQLKKELGSLKVMTSNVIASCESPDEDYGQPREPKKEGAYSDQIDSLAKNLSRSQREIKEEFHLGMQELEKKLSELSSANANCGDELRNEVGTEDPVPEVKPKCVSDQFIQDARNCADLRKSGTTCDGVYFVFHQSVRAIKVYCDMTTLGGGWTVLMRRGDFGAQMNFNLPWRVYKHGFGDINEGEFWLGNENMHLLTNGNETNQLRIELESLEDESKNFTYSSFSVDRESTEYRLHVGSPLGGGSYFLRYNNRPFVTYDRITDQPGDCGRKYKGGWWYPRGCNHPELTAQRTKTRAPLGMQSPLWREAGILKGAEMKIRPQGFHLK